MTVRDLLQRTDSVELSEWEAYERATGPLGVAYLAEVLAQIQEQLQLSNYFLGAQMEENPVEPPVKFTRPKDAFREMEEEEDSGEFHNEIRQQ